MNDPVKKFYLPILEDAKHLVTARSESYDGFGVNDYMAHGDLSYHQMCHLKITRALSESGKGGNPTDSLLDLINYAAFWLGYYNAKKEGTLK